MRVFLIGCWFVSCLMMGCPPIDDDGDDDVADDDTGDDDAGDDDAGDDDTGAPLLTLVATLPHPADGWPGPLGGLAYFDDHLWVGYGAHLWELDPGTGAVLETHAEDNGAFAADYLEGLAFDDTLWAVGATSDRLSHFHHHPPTHGDYAEWLSGSKNAASLAFDGTWLWCGMWGSIVKYDMTEDMLWAEEYAMGNHGISGLVWNDVDQALWSCGTDVDEVGNYIGRHAMDGTLDLEAVFPLDYGCTGLASDGTHLWASVYWPNGDAVKEIRQYAIDW